MARSRANKENDDEDIILVDSDEDDDAKPGPSKKARTQHEEKSAFKAGTIKKIKVHDFMTYAGTVAINPGPRLNLVLGPNGTGKSSLVCAICVGLGGSNKLLGRADNLSDYIRRGKQSCWTEITLAGKREGDRNRPDEQYILRREIRKEQAANGAMGYASTWKLNGQDTTMRAVKDLVKELNIQFENLCQFLPQDKVSEFARMNPVQMLQATQEAIGDGELDRLHKELIETRTVFTQEKKTRDEKEKDLLKLLGEQEKQQRDYERFQQREQLQKQIDQLRSKVLYLKVQSAKDSVKDCKVKLEEATKRLERKKAELKEDSRPIEKLKAFIGKTSQQREQQGKALQALRRSFDENAAKVEQAKLDLDEAITRKAQLRQQSEAYRSKLAEQEASLRQLDQDIAAAPTQPAPALLAKISNKADQVRDLHGRLTAIDNENVDRGNRIVQLEQQVNQQDQKLRQLSDHTAQRLQKMEQRRRGVSDIYYWIKNNPAEFKGPVLGPLGMEIDCLPQYAGYLENQLGNNLFNFVTTCMEDEKRLSDELARRKVPGVSYSVGAVVKKDTSLPLEHPLGTSAQYAAVGVAHSLDEVFDAPLLVKHYLADVAMINQVFICNQGTQIDQVFSALPPTREGKGSRRIVYVDGNMFVRTVSAYNRLSESTEIKDSRRPFILDSAAPSGFEDEQREVLAQKRQLERERAAVEQQFLAAKQQYEQGQVAYQKLVDELDALQAQADNVKRSRQGLINFRRIKEKALEAERKKPDPIEKQGELMQSIQKETDKLHALGAEGVKLLLQIWTNLKGCAARDLSLKEAEMQKAALEEAAERRRALVRQCEVVKQQLEEAEKATILAYTAAKSVFDAECPEVTDDDKRAFKAPPQSIDEVEQLMRDKETELDQIVCNDPNVLRDYKARANRIEQLKKEVEEADKLLAEKTATMAEVRGKWLPELTAVVEKINESFSVNFAEIGCAGEVVLDEVALQQDNYEKCALEIRVKFRESEQLQVLDVHRQSGGERSVSTLLFLIALQGVTVTPFRVIDEINQGMDPINERKVFTQLVESACRPDTPQCFLLTPKLLPGLHFSPNITILQIMNGPHIHTSLPPCMEKKAYAMYGNRAAASSVPVR